MRDLKSSLQEFSEFLLKVQRFLDYAAARQQAVPQTRMTSEVVRDYLAHLAVRQQVSASTQNQAFCAILLLCREVLGVDVETVSPGVKAKRGERLPEWTSGRSWNTSDTRTSRRR